MTTLLTTKDLQELINVDKSTIYLMAEDGRLPAINVGRQWRFPADQIGEPSNPELRQPMPGFGRDEPEIIHRHFRQSLEIIPAQGLVLGGHSGGTVVEMADT